VTARRRTMEAAAEQSAVIAALLVTGDTHVARRLQRCAAAMTSRRQGAGFPWTCRGPGCAWCREALARRWWRGMRHWIVEGAAAASLAVLPIRHAPGGIRAAVAGVRRACRDVRDRAARRRPCWRDVALAGMGTGGASAFVLIRHDGVARPELAAVLGKRWPESIVVPVGAAEPSWTMATGDAAELARARRGVESLRILVRPARSADARARRRTAAPRAQVPIDPMPIAF
jgi:hypothetical protein